MLKIWEEKEAPKKEYFLRLVTDWAGRPALAIVDEDGKPIEGGYILNIDNQGEIHREDDRSQRIMGKFGLKVDDGGHIKMRN